MTIIKRIRTLKGAGILADLRAQDQRPDFFSFNLLYGFNGSGKSTLSRLFACLQMGRVNQKLPEECDFEIELDDGTICRKPDRLTGLEDRVCVFNVDFVEREFRWGEGRANSIFYISEEQADLATELRNARAQLPIKMGEKESQDKVVSARERAVRTYRTERARTIAGSLHIGNRRYEAGQLQNDYANLPYDEGSILSDEVLDALIDVARKSAPSSALQMMEVDVRGAHGLIEMARQYAELSLGRVVLDELEKHPSMVPWIKMGHDYHLTNNLDLCLFCSGPLTEDRKAHLATALDSKIANLLRSLEESQRSAASFFSVEHLVREKWPKVSDLDLSLQAAYDHAIKLLDSNFAAVSAHLREAARIIAARLKRPTSMVKHALPTTEKIDVVCRELRSSLDSVAELIKRHNDLTSDFSKHQENARNAIKKHFLAEGSVEYKSLCASLSEAEGLSNQLQIDIDAISKKIADLSARVKKHGPAAEKITKLVRAYLGHGELTIFAADEGYELRRHGRLVRGQPSEGEKTAIALCYFLSTLEAEGRSVKDLIVIIDDPISSLDTKAMNYACSLILSRLSDASQLFVLTHNQHCMNEFRKAWRGRAYPENQTPPSAGLFYFDVVVPEALGRRLSRIVEMPAHLRSYDSEYHFLCHKILQFEAAGNGYSEYWFMMPNVMRRVLEIFLAFKAPGTHSLKDKLISVAKSLEDIDEIRVRALDRLIQVESHSDSLDDLISNSSMTVEEARDANAALLLLMAKADPGHEKAIRKQCRAA